MLGRSQLAQRIAGALGIIALGSVGLFSPISAAQSQHEPEVGGPMVGKIKRATAEQTRETKLGYAECIIRNHRELASGFVLDRSSLRIDKKFRPLVNGDCLASAAGTEDVSLEMQTVSLRFAFAEVLLRDEINSIDPAQLPGAARLQMPAPKPSDYEPKTDRYYTVHEMKDLEQARQRDQLSLVMYRFGDCVVRTDPKASRALLTTPAASAAESAGFQALMPTLATCLEKGAQLKFDPAILRGAIAFAYYSLAHAPPETANR